MKRILVAIDGSDHTQSCISVAAAIARQQESEVLLIHVVTDDKLSQPAFNAMEAEFADEFSQRTSGMLREISLPMQAEYTSVMLSNQLVVSKVANAIMGEKILEQSIAGLQQMGIESVRTLLLEGDPADCILDSQIRNDCNTIVMGCRGVSRIKGLLLGSVSQSVAHRADCSVIMVK